MVGVDVTFDQAEAGIPSHGEHAQVGVELLDHQVDVAEEADADADLTAGGHQVGIGGDELIEGASGAAEPGVLAVDLDQVSAGVGQGSILDVEGAGVDVVGQPAGRRYDRNGLAGTGEQLTGFERLEV